MAGRRPEHLSGFRAGSDLLVRGDRADEPRRAGQAQQVVAQRATVTVLLSHAHPLHPPADTNSITVVSSPASNHVPCSLHTLTTTPEWWAKWTRFMIVLHIGQCR
jgi:hypothetical protein